MDDPVHPIEPFADVPEREEPNSLSLVVVFRGANGLRAGWRLLIFFAILATLSRISLWIGRAMGRSHWLENQVVRHGLLASAAWWVTHTRAFAFAVVLIATWIMGRIEGRRVADYGLNFPNAFRRKFWQGAAIGLAAITALLGVMRAIGIFNLGATGLRGALIWKYAILWGVVFLFVALFEESLFRGYVQFTLTRGIGFWSAAALTSALFAYAHYGKSGETVTGAVSAGAAGFLFCLLLRLSGDLWMPIGFHAAWNWGETYFYGVPDSGGVASKHLFSGSFSGPQWLTGGSVGPEGSWLCVLLIASLYMILATGLGKAKSRL
jgi:uncharacterized protein